MVDSIEDYAEQVYAGVLGKIIGVYLGRPIEGWPYEEIRQRFGEVRHFVHDELGEPLIVADDDISGTFAFFRATEDAPTLPATAEQIGATWLNHIIERRTILWWGGVGRSTEHTAYFRLMSGTEAPMSGSRALNGPVLPVQVGAQIFSDGFAMMYPGDPERAAFAVRQAASVSHDGIALDAAAFLGALRALAFDVRPIDELIMRCRSFAGTGELQEVIDRVLEICYSATSWREARDRIDADFGYAKYPGPCHVVPNHAMTLASVLLGGDDFERSVMIAASAGLDTDSNAGCVGCLNAIRLGLDAVPERWRAPVADRLLVVSADGGSCVSDAAREAEAIVRAGARARGREAPASGARFTFPYRGSTQGFTACPYLGAGDSVPRISGPDGNNGVRGLKIACSGPVPGAMAISVPVFLDPHNQARNFSTVASPTLYPGQTVSLRLTSQGQDAAVRLYVLHLSEEGTVNAVFGEPSPLEGGLQVLRWQVPDLGPAPLLRLGLSIEPKERFNGEISVLDVDWGGAPEMFVVSGSLMTSIWETQPWAMRGWVSSAENFEADSAFTFALSHSKEFGLATTGARDWCDYAVCSRLVFSLHQRCGLVLRSVGHRRFYAVLFEAGKEVVVIKQRDRARTVLASQPFAYESDAGHIVEARCMGTEISVWVDGTEVLVASDPSSPHTGGGAGLMVEGGTVYVDGFTVRRLGARRHEISL